MKNSCVTAVLICLAAGPLVAADAADKEAERLANAAKAFEEIMSAPDKNIPGQLLDKAACVVIVPGMKKGGFIVGGHFGKGAVTCRTAKGWSAPVMIEMGGGSVGLQLGAEETDVVMLLMDRSGLDSLLKTKFTLGGDASVAAGPVGRATSAETDAAMQAKILTYSRSRGVFAGVDLKGTSLSQDDSANRALYGKDIDPKETLSGQVPPPAEAKPLLQTLGKYSKGVAAH